MLKAGFARLDITPGPDVSLFGYAFRQESLPPGNDGVHDPLLVRALVLDGGGDGPAALVSLDLCVLPTGTMRKLRRLVADQIETSPDRVIVSCTHTHSGPALEDFDIGYETGTKAAPDPPSDADSPARRYLRALPEKVRDAAARAAFRLYPVTASVREAALGLGYTRRVPAPDGLAHCWSPHEQFDLDPPPMIDPTCTLLALREVDGPRQYLLWGLGAHGVVLGPVSRCVSADWPGLACSALERRVPESRAIFLAGASGDVHPWIATQERTEYLHPVADAAASFVALLAHGTRGARERPSLACASRTVEIAGHELDLSAWRVGPCRVVTVPVELFSALALELRQKVGGPLLLATVSQGWIGYWPTKEAFAEGGYEIDIARRKGLEPGDGERLIEAAASVAAEVD